MTSLNNFPCGLCVLVVDDDAVTLQVVKQMCQRAGYQVSTATSGAEALDRLRDKSLAPPDLVLSDVMMPDIDGFRLLELIGLELDLPVIMMSSNGETDVVLRGVTHGAVDFLIKPVRIEELRNMWQHVVRRRREMVKEESDDHSGERDDMACDMSHKKRKEQVITHVAGGDAGDDDTNVSKKARVVWSVEMHQQFVNAVNQLGIEKAVPKKILEIMQVEGLTRENVASHLQKYRLYLRRVASVSGADTAFTVTAGPAGASGAPSPPPAGGAAARPSSPAAEKTPTGRGSGSGSARHGRARDRERDRERERERERHHHHHHHASAAAQHQQQHAGSAAASMPGGGSHDAAAAGVAGPAFPDPMLGSPMLSPQLLSGLGSSLGLLPSLGHSYSVPLGGLPEFPSMPLGGAPSFLSGLEPLPALSELPLGGALFQAPGGLGSAHHHQGAASLTVSRHSSDGVLLAGGGAAAALRALQLQDMQHQHQQQAQAQAHLFEQQRSLLLHSSPELGGYQQQHHRQPHQSSSQSLLLQPQPQAYDLGSVGGGGQMCLSDSGLFAHGAGDGLQQQQQLMLQAAHPFPGGASQTAFATGMWGCGAATGPGSSLVLAGGLEVMDLKLSTQQRQQHQQHQQQLGDLGAAAAFAGAGSSSGGGGGGGAGGGTAVPVDEALLVDMTHMELTAAFNELYNDAGREAAVQAPQPGGGAAAEQPQLRQQPPAQQQPLGGGGLGLLPLGGPEMMADGSVDDLVNFLLKN